MTLTIIAIGVVAACVGAKSKGWKCAALLLLATTCVYVTWAQIILREAPGA